jgi:hypothetical protein
VSRVGGCFCTRENKPTGGGGVRLTRCQSQPGQRTGNVNIPFAGLRICASEKLGQSGCYWWKRVASRCRPEDFYDKKKIRIILQGSVVG